MSINVPVATSRTYAGERERVSMTVDAVMTTYTWDPAEPGTVVDDGGERLRAPGVELPDRGLRTDGFATRLTFRAELDSVPRDSGY